MFGARRWKEGLVLTLCLLSCWEWLEEGRVPLSSEIFCFFHMFCKWCKNIYDLFWKLCSRARRQGGVKEISSVNLSSLSTGPIGMIRQSISSNFGMGNEFLSIVLNENFSSDFEKLKDWNLFIWPLEWKKKHPNV